MLMPRRHIVSGKMNSTSHIFELTDTLAVVTGAGKGNGSAIAQGLRDAGSVVIGIDKTIDSDNSFMQITGDVTDKATITRVHDEIVKIDHFNLVLVNNAGVSYPEEEPYPEDLWRETLEVNLTAPFIWIEALRSLFLKAGSGSIINITSLGAERAFPANPAYIASKGGLKMLTKYYAKALGKNGVRVNNVGPGYMVTDMTSASYGNAAARESRKRHTFLDRWGDPDDLVGLCVFLSSPASSYITGQDIYVDGGWLANGLAN